MIHPATHEPDAVRPEAHCGWATAANVRASQDHGLGGAGPAADPSACQTVTVPDVGALMRRLAALEAVSAEERRQLAEREQELEQVCP
eukprot:COSAG01_NODE_2425_length_7679_cov_96.031221_7_plen_88_part_00